MLSGVKTLYFLVTFTRLAYSNIHCLVNTTQKLTIMIHFHGTDPVLKYVGIQLLFTTVYFYQIHISPVFHWQFGTTHYCPVWPQSVSDGDFPNRYMERTPQSMVSTCSSWLLMMLSFTALTIILLKDTRASLGLTSRPVITKKRNVYQWMSVSQSQQYVS